MVVSSDKGGASNLFFITKLEEPKDLEEKKWSKKKWSEKVVKRTEQKKQSRRIEQEEWCESNGAKEMG